MPDVRAERPIPVRWCWPSARIDGGPSRHLKGRWRCCLQTSTTARVSTTAKGPVWRSVRQRPWHRSSGI
ncbi:hypothetical protein GZH78_13175 [Pseudomonas fluorescens]|nr:hypothetical protein GZH78_13175 [Pseudomonas fluorescens]